MKTQNLANFLKRFFSYYLLAQKGLALNTILAYRDAMKLLLCFAADTLQKSVEALALEDLNETLILAFLEQIEKARGCCPATRNARLAAIRAFFGFIAREEPQMVAQAQLIGSIPRKRTGCKTA